MCYEPFGKWWSENYALFPPSAKAMALEAYNLATQPQWQPIETAPKDGDHFNMFCYGMVFPACWHRSHHKFYDLCRDEYVDEEDLINAKWQPLPPPPTGEK